MHVFYFPWPSMLAVFGGIALVVMFSFLLSRRNNAEAKTLDSVLLALTALFCIETIWLTFKLVPSAEYALGSQGVDNPAVIDDWISVSGIGMGDIYFSWALIFLCVGAAHFVKQAGKSQLPLHWRTLYDHFGATAALAVLITSIFYVFVAIPGYFEQDIQIMEKVLFRGVIPFVTVGLFFWVLANSVLLARQLVFQRKHDMLIRKAFDSGDLTSALSDAPARSLLKARMDEITHLVDTPPKDPSVYTQLIDQQSQMEREELDISIHYLHTAMWAIPVLGFLGTVWGIAEAVSNLIPLLQGLSAAELGGSQLAGALAGLGVAFDTTLVALGLSLPAMGMIALLEKNAYEDRLQRSHLVMRHIRSLSV